MKNWQGTLGELIATIYEECEVEFGDVEAAAEVTRHIVNELIENDEDLANLPVAA